jgi:hypothetical protein
LTADDGAALFPITTAQTCGEPIALLAGHPVAHAEAVRDLNAVRVPTGR